MATRIYLPQVEVRIYFLCHIAFVLYSIWTVFSFRKEIHESRDGGDAFSSGWWGVDKEVGDYEWETFKNYVRVATPWLPAHVVLSNLLKIGGFRQLLPIGYTIIGVGFIISENGLLPIAFLFLNIIPYFLIRKGNYGGRAVLILAILSLIVANVTKLDVVYFWLTDHTRMTHERLFQMVVVNGWATLKCISFTLDAQDEKEEVDKGEYSLSHFLGYVFYFPTLYLGPPIIYSRFKSCYKDREDITKDTKTVIKTFVKDILTVLFWFLVLEFSHHFLYLSTLQYSKTILNKLNIMSLFGYGYLMGQHFQVKYVVLYGFACAFAKLDNIDTPPKPICVARVHKYSDMWKHFDRGLYEFLVKYIYGRFQRIRTQSSGNNGLQKLLAMFITFAFIYVWHGYFLAILAWSVLNVVGILLEQALNSLQRSSVYQKWIRDKFSLNNVLRIEALLGTHLLVLAVIANFFFLANYNVGVLFIHRTYCSGVIEYLGLSTSLSFIYFTSEFCKRRLKVIASEHSMDTKQ